MSPSRDRRRFILTASQGTRVDIGTWATLAEIVRPGLGHPHPHPRTGYPTSSKLAAARCWLADILQQTRSQRTCTKGLLAHGRNSADALALSFRKLLRRRLWFQAWWKQREGWGLIQVPAQLSSWIRLANLYFLAIRSSSKASHPE